MSSLFPWWEFDLSHTTYRRKGRPSGFFGLCRWKNFLPSAILGSLLLSSVWNLEVFAHRYWVIRKSSSYCSLFLLPFLFSLYHAVAQGFPELLLWFQKLSYRVFLFCFFFFFYWLDHIHPCSLTNQKFLFFWLIHFLYQEFSEWTTILYRKVWSLYYFLFPFHPTFKLLSTMF